MNAMRLLCRILILLVLAASGAGAQEFDRRYEIAVEEGVIEPSVFDFHLRVEPEEGERKVGQAFHFRAELGLRGDPPPQKPRFELVIDGETYPETQMTMTWGGPGEYEARALLYDGDRLVARDAVIFRILPAEKGAAARCPSGWGQKGGLCCAPKVPQWDRWAIQQAVNSGRCR